MALPSNNHRTTTATTGGAYNQQHDDARIAQQQDAEMDDMGAFLTAVESTRLPFFTPNPSNDRTAQEAGPVATIIWHGL